MPRLNNKDYTVEELERLIYLVDRFTNVSEHSDPILDELENLIKGSKFTNFLEEKDKKPVPIPLNFEFKMLINPETIEMDETIKNAIRSVEVMENIKNRFNGIVREEVNWYIDRVKYLMLKGDTIILE